MTFVSAVFFTPSEPLLVGTAGMATGKSLQKEKLYYLKEAYLFYVTFFFSVALHPTRVMASSFLRFLNHTQRRTTVSRTPLDE